MTLQTFWPMLKKEFHEQYRTYRALIALIILLLLGLSAPIITKITPDLLQNLGNGIKVQLPPPTANDALTSYIKNMVELPAVMIVLLAMGCVADERSRGTAITVLTKPVPRSVFVLAKFLAYAVTLLVSIALTAAGTYFYTDLLFSPLPLGPFVILNLAMYIFLLQTLALTVLASVLFRNTVAAGGLAFAGFIALGILPNLSPIIAQGLPLVLLSSELLPKVLASTAPLGDILWPFGIGLALVAVFIGAACFVFRWQEV